MNRLGVTASKVELGASAARLAGKLNLPFLQDDQTCAYDLLLQVSDDGLALVPLDRILGKELRIDFVRGSTAYRRVEAGATRQPLARALGLRQGHRNVFDATAGLGRDAFLLACLGCRVTAAERSPILAAMLLDALQRAQTANDRKLAEIVQRIRVLSGDSKQILLNLPIADRPDVVYLDPMYVPRASSALAKKEMRILRMLVGGDEDADDLLRIARKTAFKRVVVKRHLRTRPLAENVTMSFPGRTVRYDVYLKSTPK